MRIYEELFIVRPDATQEEVDPLIDQLKNVITHAGGTLEKVDKWGVRKLAYRVLKYNEGQYILLQFNAQPETVKEIERRLRVADFVLKFITVRIDEKLKRIEKRKKAREKRAARQPVSSPSAPAASSRVRTGRTGISGPRCSRRSRVLQPLPRHRQKGRSNSGRRKSKRNHNARTKEAVVRSRHRNGLLVVIRQLLRARNNISGARRFAASASKKLTTSITKM